MDVMRATPGESRLEMCIQCGTCGGSCPSGMDMDHTPQLEENVKRTLGALALLAPLIATACTQAAPTAAQAQPVLDLPILARQDGRVVDGDELLPQVEISFDEPFEAAYYEVTSSPEDPASWKAAMIATCPTTRRRSCTATASRSTASPTS